MWIFLLQITPWGFHKLVSPLDDANPTDGAARGPANVRPWTPHQTAMCTPVYRSCKSSTLLYNNTTACLKSFIPIFVHGWVRNRGHSAPRWNFHGNLTYISISADSVGANDFHKGFNTAESIAITPVINLGEVRLFYACAPVLLALLNISSLNKNDAANAERVKKAITRGARFIICWTNEQTEKRSK